MNSTKTILLFAACQAAPLALVRGPSAALVVGLGALVLALPVGFALDLRTWLRG